MVGATQAAPLHQHPFISTPSPAPHPIPHHTLPRPPPPHSATSSTHHHHHHVNAVDMTAVPPRAHIHRRPLPKALHATRAT